MRLRLVLRRGGLLLRRRCLCRLRLLHLRLHERLLLLFLLRRLL
jgi:hypothetical protein